MPHRYMQYRAAFLAALLATAAAHAPAAGNPAASARFERFSYAGQAQERAVPGPGEFVNPVLAGYFPDPSIVRVGDDYFAVASSFTTDTTFWVRLLLTGYPVASFMLVVYE